MSRGWAVVTQDGRILEASESLAALASALAGRWRRGLREFVRLEEVAIVVDETREIGESR